MRFVPTRIHGVVDYVTALFLMVMPWLLGFAAGGAETWVPVVLGAGIILYSVFTDYELGVVHRLSMRAHLALDAGGGVLLAISPWLFGFADVVFWPFVIIGLFEVVMSIVTHLQPHRGAAARDTSSVYGR